MFLIRFLFKFVFSILLIGLILAVCVTGLIIWTAPKTMPKLIDEYLERKTGFTSSIDNLELKAMGGKLSMQGVTIYNPDSYEENIFFIADDIVFDVQPSTLIKDQIIADEVVIDLNNINIVRNKSNSINVVEFGRSFKSKKKSRSSTDETGQIQTPPKAEKIKKKRSYLIKILTIKIKTATLHGFSESSKTLNLNYSKTFTDVTDINTVISNLKSEFKALGVNMVIQDLANKATDGTLNNTPFKEKIDNKIDKASKGIKKLFAPLK